MQWIDAVNAAFEIGGGIATWINVHELLRVKNVRGVHWLPTLYWTIYGFWSLIYFAKLSQPISFWAAVSLALGQVVWLALMFKYRGNNGSKKKRRG